MRLRSIVLVAADGSGLEQALSSEADAIAVTVADASEPGERLRERARQALPRISEAGKRGLAVVNHPRTRLLRDDLEALVSEHLSGVLLPHAVEPQDARDLAVLLREFELGNGIEPGAVLAFPVIDTARGVLRAAEIAAAVPRVAGLLFDGPGYAHDVGAREEEHGHRLAYARGAVVTAARARDVLPLIRANPFELQQLGHYGFAGAVLESATGVQAANQAFAPSEWEVSRARAQLAAYTAARVEGAWAARHGSEVVEADTARRARQLLDQAGLEA